jgi:ATP-binding cassette subfamily C (CFTR/MRP) protein 4
LGELKPVEGTVKVNGRVSYASQDPWVFSATLRENVLFGSPYDRKWYNKVIKVCALDKVRSSFSPHGMHASFFFW